MKRINYVDNLRWMTVALLILFHAAIAYNVWGEANYVFLDESRVLSSVVILIAPWFMSLMFLLAGVASRFSLRKRSFGAFAKERLLRLGMPLLFGVAVISPALSFVADVAHNGYVGNYFEHYGVFFTKFTDLTGYDGGFCFGHLWFILALLLFSLAVLPLLVATKKVGRCTELSIGVVVVVLAIVAFDAELAGKPLLTYLGAYLAGYYLFSDQDFVARLAKWKWAFAMAFVMASIMNVVLFVWIDEHEVFNNACKHAAFVFGVLAAICVGHDCLDFSNGVTKFCSELSYVFYTMHFPIVVLCQYALWCFGVSAGANFGLTLLIVYPVTLVICMLIKKIKIARLLFGLKI